MDPELRELLPHTVTHAAPDGTYTDRGQVNFAAGTDYAAYIEPTKGEEVVRLASGEERVARWRVYVNSTSALSPLGKLTLPSGYDPQTPPILSSALVADETGGNHVVLMV